MIGDFLRLAAGEAEVRLRGCVAAAVLGAVTAVFFIVAIGFGTAAAYAALAPELGAAWTLALIGGVFLAVALMALTAAKLSRRRRLVQQMAMARARAASVPPMSPEMMLLAAAAGAAFTFLSPKR